MKIPAPSPALAFVEAVTDAGIYLEINHREQKLIMRPSSGPEMDALHHSKKAVQRFLEAALRQKVLQDLVNELEGPGKRSRKDMIGIKGLTDKRVTLSLLKTRKSPIKDLPVRMFKRILVTILSGAVRAKDRLKAAGLLDCDVCDVD